MKATEVLNRYANGERDFRHADLRGQSFIGQDLSGADFTEADIRGANFSSAVLKRTNFTGVQAGVQSRWMVGQFIAASWFASLISIASVGINRAFIERVVISKEIQPYTVIPVILLLLINAIVIFTIARQGFTAKIAKMICLIGFVAGFVAITAGSPIINSATLVTVLGAIILAPIVTKTGVLVYIFSAVLAIVFASAGAVVIDSFAFAVARSVMRAVTDNFTFDAAFKFTSTDGLIIGGAIPVAALSLYIESCILQGNKEFSIIGKSVLAFTTISGTAFCGADLTDVNFTGAILTSTDFNNTKHSLFFNLDAQEPTCLDHVCWRDAKDLELARLEDSILVDSRVRRLLTTYNGYKKSYIDANLRGANLNGVNLEHADLRWADLSGATLKQAKLRDANLLEAPALNTDFTGATFTGACLEAWNIDSNTKLEGVDCQYVYLLRDQQERRPSSGDFAPGDFTKLFQKALNTIDLIFRNGVDWKAFVAAFKTVRVENEGTELSIQSIEDRDDGVIVVRVKGSPDGDKAKTHSSITHNYEVEVLAARLNEKEQTVTILQGVIDQVINRYGSIPTINVINTAISESKAMSDSTNKSQSVNIGGNVTGSTINLGAISSSVSNVVSQLPSALDPAQPGIKELLIELQAAIESDADLPEKGKASALEQVKVLAEAAQDPEQPEKKGLGSQAITFFKNAASFLPDTAKLAEACTKLLPLITKALGLPF